MNTPAHLILSAVVLGRNRNRAQWPAIVTGALLPDLPMFGFYLYERLYVGRTEDIIWSTLYFDPDWQYFFDLFNSLPLIAVGLVFAAYRKSKPALAFFLSMILHIAADLPLHREDAHAHFFPFTNWHFNSPVSYWDPAHFGMIAGALEFLGVLVGSVVLIRRGTPWHFVGYGTLAVYLAFAIFVIHYWAS